MLTLSQFQPVSDRVIIRQDDMPEKSKDGFYIPKTARNTQRTARVLAAGPDSTLKPGARVYFLHKNPLIMEIREGVVMLVPELDIVGEI